ncbi:glycosyltransferase [Deinococcus peraridilitoris DSM 19664]|uniref:Glycosyltransferase n=1 Tax=Deinococcus peraridilitoris (strain DSM 19664 / LMG 22246 / CIP 109416 / KR-200) TaxID=937777 RepID=K9ZXS6_DEIPD|nr:glycosyltransferase [Deinococcus peraridilitoris DSM 19664]
MNAHHDLLCISHLRWNFVYQRPQHLMTRAAKNRRVFYVEEPIHYPPDLSADEAQPRLDVSEDHGVTVIVPRLSAELTGDCAEEVTRGLLHAYLKEQGVERPVAWVYTPMRLPLLDGLSTGGVVYDCMDELANFHHAPPQLRERERQLFDMADVVFTGGYRLWESKRTQHDNAHPFPSSVDVAHFARARSGLPDPQDQQGIPGPRLGFFGVIDERFDIELIAEVARRRPEWQFVLLGPVVKIDEADLPRGENLHYLGMKKYAELPQYLAHWDVALLPFARNEATEFISPTKTPEYLAAGVPVVSTDIRDVVRPYGEKDLVRIARDTDEFEAAIEASLREDNSERQRRADALLAQMSWDLTWKNMDGLMAHAMAEHDPIIKSVRNDATIAGVADD